MSIWSTASADEALRNGDRGQKRISPFHQANCQWLLSEAAFEAAERAHLLHGSVYVYDDYDRCILEDSVPPLPQGEYLF